MLHMKEKKMQRQLEKDDCEERQWKEEQPTSSYH